MAKKLEFRRARTSVLGRTIALAMGLSGLCCLPMAGQGYSHGTAGVVIASAEKIVAAIDSKEVNREYLSDGTSVSDDRISCKVRHTGPYYTMVAGISRATDGFDALRMAGALYREGDSLDTYASRLAVALPDRLATILTAVRLADGAAFDRSFRGQDVLQLTLLGAERDAFGSHPRAVVIAFRAWWDEQSHRVGVEGQRAGCPGDCGNRNAIYLIGMHEEAQHFVDAYPDVARDVTADRALQLIRIEYASHPETVGGPATVVRVTSAGAELEETGACEAVGGVANLATQLSETLAAVENVVVSEDISQFSRRGGTVHAGAIHASVRVVDGSEQYDWNDPREMPAGLPQPGLPQPGLPTPWCSGELATMLRVTRYMLVAGRGTLHAPNEWSPENALSFEFRAPAAESYWQLVVDARKYPLAFDGQAWFSSDTGRLLRIHWQTIDLKLPASSGITRIEWDETFVTNEIAGRPYLTPDTAVYRVYYSQRADRTDWTETRFSDFRRFGATENVRYGEASLR